MAKANNKVRNKVAGIMTKRCHVVGGFIRAVFGG